MVDAIKTAYKDPFEPIFEKGLHKGTINGLSSCVARAILVTLGQDKTCKFWEYGAEIKGLFSYSFIETPNCIDLHPLSHALAVGFKDGVRIYYCLENEIKQVFSDNMKSCYAVSYST